MNISASLTVLRAMVYKEIYITFTNRNFLLLTLVTPVVLFGAAVCWLLWFRWRWVYSWGWIYAVNGWPRFWSCGLHRLFYRVDFLAVESFCFHRR